MTHMLASFVHPGSDESVVWTHDALIITMHVAFRATIPLYDVIQHRVMLSGLFSKQTAYRWYIHVGCVDNNMCKGRIQDKVDCS